jgi:hypothetical protein
VVDVFGAVIGVEAPDREGKGGDELPQYTEVRQLNRKNGYFQGVH